MDKKLKTKYLSYDKAKKFVHNLKLSKRVEWEDYCKNLNPDIKPIPNNIPKAPGYIYKNNGWKGWGDWLGTGNISPLDREFLSYQDAKKFVHKLKLKSLKEWKQYCKGLILDDNKIPSNIPKAPNQFYKNSGWIDWLDWLGLNKNN